MSRCARIGVVLVLLGLGLAGPAPASVRAHGGAPAYAHGGGPAFAHGGEAPDGSDYRTAVGAISPAVPGLTVRAIEAGARLELVNRTGRAIEVLGYDGEPYLEARPDGVYENTRSPATYLNETLAGAATVPASADPTAAPEWRRVSDRPVARWHDRRTRWTQDARPPQVIANPGRGHRVRDWVVPLRDQVSTVEVRGTLDWVPPPVAPVWWLLTLLAALPLAALGVTWDRAARVLAGVGALGGVVAVAYAVAREIDAGATSVGTVLLGMLTGQTWTVLTGLGVIAAGIYTVVPPAPLAPAAPDRSDSEIPPALDRSDATARRPAADLALGLAGACLALIAAATNGAVFSRGVAPVPWDPMVARLATAVVLAAGTGLAGAAAVRLRAEARTTAPLPPA